MTDQSPGAYECSVEVQHRAALYVCGRLPKADAITVLQALGLAPYPSTHDRDSLGRATP